MIYGTITDASGQPVPRALVMVVHGSGAWRDVAAMSNEAGEFAFSYIEAGEYELMATHAEHHPASAVVKVLTGIARQVNFQLQKKEKQT